MQIRFQQLKDSLNLSTISTILISGNEPYQQMLAADKVRKHATDLGFVERKILTVESGFNWSELELAASNMSLFSERILIDLRIPTGKPGATGSKAIVKLINEIPQDVMLLVQTPKLDRTAMNSAWVKAIDKSGLVLRVWELNESETKDWIRRKLVAMGYTASTNVIDFICQHVEGNLLAAMQEIEKISLVNDSEIIDIKSIQKALADNSHYSLNQLIEAMQNKNSTRIVRILNALEKEEFATPLLLWGLTEHIRRLTDKKNIYTKNKNYSSIQLLERLSYAHQQSIGAFNDDREIRSSSLLKQCAWTDRVIKGRANSNPWRELLQLSIAVNLIS